MKRFLALAALGLVCAMPAQARTLELCYGTARHCDALFETRAPQDVAYGACVQDMLAVCDVKYGASPGLMRRILIKRMLSEDHSPQPQG